jgi:hypothetical protein
MKIGLFQILLEINLVGLGEDFPIDVADVVAGDVLPMLGEFDGDSLIRRAVHAGHEAFDDEAGAQVERGDARQRARVEVFAIIGGGFGHL